MDILARYRGALLGLAAGDAVGVAAEFMERGSFKPVTDLVGGGPYGLRPGEWTDDTSMALCMASSLVAQGGFDPVDEMERYWRWFRDGYMSSTGSCFDIGTTTGRALQRYKETGDPFAGSTDPNTSGNGGIMRLAPVVLFYHPDREKVLHYAVESSRLTHASPECLDAARLLADVIHRALNEAARTDIMVGSPVDMFETESIRSIARGDYQLKLEDEIRGTGHVVRALEAALWCFAKTYTFEGAILKAVNLGDDADTTAAICGQVAGAYYGDEGIPGRWLDRLVMRTEIRILAEALYSKESFRPKGSK